MGLIPQWRDALNKFIEDYKKNKDVVAILLVGSYAAGNNNEYSDIDVYIIINNNCNYRERGNRLVNGYIIEYFINPLWKVEDYLDNDGRGHGGSLANMILYGELLYGNGYVIEYLKNKALEAVNKKNEIDVMKYYRCWDAYEDYKACKYHNEMPYYICLKYLIEAYLYNNDYFLLPECKIERFFKDDEYRKRYHVKFPNNEFNRMVINCFDNPCRENIDILYEFVIRDGNFDINNFKYCSKLEKR